MTVESHRASAPAAVGFAVLTVSTSRDLAADRSGDEVVRLLEAGGQQVVDRRLVPDGTEPVRDAVEALLARPDVEAIVVTGGTGLSPSDQTPEAVEPLFDRPVPGFGELFRWLSWQEVGAAAMLSRATAGVVGSRVIYLLPGSPKAVALALERLVMPEVGHLLGQLRRPG